MSQATKKQPRPPRPTRPEADEQRQALAWVGRRLAWERWMEDVHRHADAG